MSELTSVHGTTNEDRIGDVVFVHGLGGDAVAYWQSGPSPDTFWPAWLAKEAGFAAIGIWSLAYNAVPFAWQGEAMPLYSNAKNALEQLTLNGIGGRPVVFITHSLGGLLVKKMMQAALGLKTPEWLALARHTRGVAFIATPHSGAALARYVSYIGFLLGATISADELTDSSSALVELNEWYRANVGFDAEGELPLRSLVYYEESRTSWKWFKPFGVFVVGRASADPGIKGVVPIGIARDHRTIHKPPTPGDQVYLGVRRHIQECLLPGFLANSPAAWSSPLVGNVPVPPPGFVTRSGITAQIEEALRASPRTPGAVTVLALQGIPGAGKTTIAAYLARTLALRQQFGDGVLWLTLGPRPGNLRNLAGGIIQAFDRSYQPREQQTTLGRLKEILRPKRCLLILDDLWDPTHARALLPDGPRCKVLLTTRDAALAHELGARILPVDVLEPDEALALLSQHTGQALSPRDEAVARAICVDLGFHPLALHLAAAQISAGASWTELRDGLRDETRQLLVLEPSDEGWSLDEQRTRSVLASFELSTRRLDPDAQRAFAWLGVLQHTSLEAGFLTTLWSLDRAATERLLRHLAAKGFLTEIRSEATVGVKYELHALLHRFARRLLLRTVGGTLAHAHGLFLDRYGVTAGGKSWFDVADDGYIYEQLAWHLKSADRLKELFDLLRAETIDGTHQWYAACERHGKSAAFLTTVREAGRAARERYSLTRDPEDAGVVLRCLLLAATSNSVGLIVGADLLVALVKAGLWSLDQALTRVRQRQDRDDRIWTLLRLIEQFPEEIGDDVRLEVLEAISSVPEVITQQQMVARLAPHVAGRPAMIDTVVKLLLGGFVEPNWIMAVTILRRFAPDEAIEALAQVRLIEPDESWRAWSTVVLSARLGDWSMQQARDAAMRITYPLQRALALMSIAETLPEQPVSLIRSAVQAFAEAERPYDLEIIKAIGPYATLSEDLIAAFWNAVRRLVADDEYSSDRDHANAIAALASYLRGHQSIVGEALVVARAFADPHARAVALAGLSAVADANDRNAIAGELEALADAATGTSDAQAIFVAVSGSPVTTRRDELLRRALQLAMAPDDRDVWLTALTRVIRASPKAVQSEIARRAIAALRPITAGAVPRLIALMELLPESDRDALVAEVQGSAEGWSGKQQAGSLAALAPHPSAQQLAGDATRSMSQAAVGADSLSGADKAAPAPERAATFEQAWDEYEAVTDPIERAYSRSQLLADAPPDQLSARIASLLPALALPRSEAHHEDYQASTIIGIAKSNMAADGAIVATLEAEARAMNDPYNRAASLAVLIPYLDAARGQSAFDAAVDAARLIERLDHRSLVFVDFLLPVCPLPRRPPFAAEALRVVIKWGRMNTERAARLVDELLAGNHDALWAAWGELEEELTNQSRATVLGFIANCGALLDRLFGEDGAAAISQAVLDVGRWFPAKREQ